MCHGQTAILTLVAISTPLPSPVKKAPSSSFCRWEKSAFRREPSSHNCPRLSPKHADLVSDSPVLSSHPHPSFSPSDPCKPHLRPQSANRSHFATMDPHVKLHFAKDSKLTSKSRLDLRCVLCPVHIGDLLTEAFASLILHHHSSLHTRRAPSPCI